ncbi:WbqC family protein [Ralstonia sp. R-29]|uniref:WbqC family protein n=1 Tax=Ralstonia sp. R-29 TaxID=3404059 RepID=UPI003CE8FBBF
MKVVITQPMLFPWVGLLEQIELADVLVNYADVQFSKGSFTNRVQIKEPTGTRWMTVPLEKFHLGARIDEVKPASNVDWRAQHLRMLEQAYEAAPYAGDMLALVRSVYEVDYTNMGALALASMRAVCRYLGIELDRKFVDAPELDIPGRNTDRVLAIVQKLQGDTYITGHGAKNYLAHAEFEQHGITVEYMNYAMRPYGQLHGAFTPFVSSLDLIANQGPAGKQYVSPQTLNWREFIQ